MQTLTRVQFYNPMRLAQRRASVKSYSRCSHRLTVASFPPTFMTSNSLSGGAAAAAAGGASQVATTAFGDSRTPVAPIVQDEHTVPPPVHDVPDSQLLCKRVSIPNIRDIAEAVPGELRYGRVMRCANPGHACPQDVELLLQDVGLRELIDLRSSEELEEDHHALLFQHASFARYTRRWWSRQTAHEVPGERNGGSFSGRSLSSSVLELTIDPEASTASGPGEPKALTRTQISLLERSRFYQGLTYKLPVSVTVPAILLSRVSKAWSRDRLLPHVNEGGLFLLYEILLDSAQPEIGRVLQHILSAVEADRPVLFFCKAGKDRTGLVAMMVLACCGASDEQITADYVRSGAYHVMALAGIEKRPELQGLNKETFEASPPEACKHALAYARKTYGSLQQYMVRCGFGVEEQARLRRLLRIKSSTADNDVMASGEAALNKTAT